MLSFKPLTKTLALSIALLTAAGTLAFDLSKPLGIAGGMPYVALPVLGLLARSPFIVVAAAITGTVLTGVGWLLSPNGVTPEIVLTNRVMGAALIWLVAWTNLRHLQNGMRLERALRKLAATDPLTGLYNRRHLFASIEAELKRHERYGGNFSVMLIDADHFKKVNDMHGHVAGDGALCRIASVCRETVRESDIVGRFGGEEFIILLPHTPASRAATVAERIRAAMHESNRQPSAGGIAISLSLGVAETGPGATSFDDLLKAADEALYAAKRAGRDRVVIKAVGAGTAEDICVA